MSTIMRKVLSVILAITIILSAAPISIHAASDNVKREKVNVLRGKQPTTNSQVGGIKNSGAATDGRTNTPDNDRTNTEISAGEEVGGSDNGYRNWKHVYLEYDFGKVVPVSEVKIYRNRFTTADTTFKKVKVELSETPDFNNAQVIFGEEDVRDVLGTSGHPQVLTLDQPKNAQYIRVWGQGQYIENHNGNWSGYSNAVRFQEIEVYAYLPKEDGGAEPEPEPEPSVPEGPQGLHNIAKNKLPFVYGLTPTDIANITDGNWDNYAVHNSHGERYLQFEYKNEYPIKQIEFKLEPGRYESIKITVSNDPKRAGREVHSEYKFNQTEEKNVVVLPRVQRGSSIRFTVNKSNNEPTKYAEIAIYSQDPLSGEEKPEYQAPESKYNTLVWSDDFDTLDEEKWNVIEGMANHGAIYNRQAISIEEDGGNKYLAIRSKNYDTTEALKQAVGYDDYDGKPLASHVTWSSGRLESKNKFSFQYGRMATRAKVNDSQGIWPAIWMLCQDETGHDEIDVLEYLGQNAHGAWTTNHFGIWGKNKDAHGEEQFYHEAWSQDFHVYEVVWDPERIIWYIDGQEVFRTSRGKHLDSMHRRPMFPILETQVGDGWVGPVDYNKQETKQDSKFLIDWIRVYQEDGQPIARFDDLEATTGGKKNKYRIAKHSSSEGLMTLTEGSKQYENKNNFYYGGQPRYESNRIAVKEDAQGEQYIVYEVPGVKDVHLTAYYQTLADKMVNSQYNNAGQQGVSIRKAMRNDDEINFIIYTSTDGQRYTPFYRTTVVDNFIEVHPGFARTTFDAYDLPQGTRFVKIKFPDYKGKKYRNGSRQEVDIKNTDIQLAKVTFLQEPQAEEEEEELPIPQPLPGNNENLKVFPSLREYAVSQGNLEKTALKRMVIVNNDLAQANARVKEAVQLVNQEFAAYGVPTTTSLPIHFIDKDQVQDGDIVVELKDSINGIEPEEGFTVNVNKHITIEAKNSNGVMYALRSIMQYMQLYNAMPYGLIKDYPDTIERALHLDMGRKYFTPAWIKRVIRELSFMRVNALQLHFSEHEGFRLESEVYPDIMSDKYISKAEMRSIIAEAKKYGIEIIPSFDNPGHLRHALGRYPQFRLKDRNGVPNSGALDITNPEARQFVKDFLKEYAELFNDSKYFHIGGDEFINFNEFWKYPKLQEYGVSKVGPGATGQDGYMSYIKEIAEYVHDELGFIPRVWNDGVYRSNLRYTVTLPEYVQVCYWTQWDVKMPTLQKILQHGHDLINVNDTMYYVLSNGNSYVKKPDPEHIYKNITLQTFPDKAHHKPSKERVKGLTYAIWCDIPNKETEDYIRDTMHFSLRAMAEKAWAGKQVNGNYDDFKALLDTLRPIIDPDKQMPAKQEVNYKEGLVEVLFEHHSNKNQILGHTEMRVGASGTQYQYDAPEFKEFEYKSSDGELRGNFTTNKKVVLNYEEVTQLQSLQRVIAEKLAEQDYVAQSYVTYNQAIAKAQGMVDAGETSDRKITRMLNEIKSAEGKLIKKVFEELYNKLHNPKPEGEYTRISYREYKKVVNRLKEKIQGKDIENSKLAEFNRELEEAEKQLRPKSGEVDPNDKREQLRLAIEEARAIKETGRYKNATKSLKDSFDEALTQAEATYDNDNVAPIILIFTINGLRSAMNKLDGNEDTPIVPPVDKAPLKAQIERAKALENSEKYQHAGDDKQREFTEALAEAKRLDGEDAPAKDAVERSTQRLKNAVDAIAAVEVPVVPEPVDLEPLKEQIKRAEALQDSAKYQNAGEQKQNEFNAALEEARGLVAADAAQKEAVEASTTRLKKAVDDVDAVIIPTPEGPKDPEEPQPLPQPQPEPLLPYIPQVDPTPAEEVIEEETTPLASPEEISKWTEGLEKASDKELVKRWLEKEARPEEVVKFFTEEGLTNLSKQVTQTFGDEKENSWYQKELGMAVFLNLVNGYEDGTFRAENKVTGKELVAILLRTAKVEVKEDEKDWFAPYLEAAKKEKLLADITFDLAKELTREEVALLTYNFLMMKRDTRLLPNTKLAVEDKTEVDAKFTDAVSYLYEKKILKGYEDNTYRPKNNVKRSEVVAIIYRLLKNR